MPDKIKKCEGCGKPMHPLDEGRWHKACDLRRVRKLLQKSLKEKITKLEAELAATRELLKDVKQYVQDEFRGMAFDEEQEQEWKDRGQKIIDAITTALKGEGGE